MSTIQLQRALMWALLATLIAFIGVATVAWIRRPRGGAAPAGGGRPGLRAVLANEPDGSVYDLNLKVEELQDEVQRREKLDREQRRRLEAMRLEREVLSQKLKNMQEQLDKLQAQLDTLQRAQPAASGATTKPAQPAASGSPGKSAPSSQSTPPAGARTQPALPGGPVATPKLTTPPAPP